MNIAKGLDEISSYIPSRNSGTILTIGNFDGIHQGHQQLLSQLVNRSKVLRSIPAAVTFEPHPLKILAPNLNLKQILMLPEKILLMEDLGIELLAVLPFTKNLAHLSPESFINEVVVEKLQAHEVHVGPDFHFGHRQEGDTTLLSKLAKRFGFEVNIMPTLKIRGQPVSSTRIRELVESGRIGIAARLLGRPFSFNSSLIGGRGIGRVHTVPTLNLSMEGGLVPKIGVYITNTYLQNKSPNQRLKRHWFKSLTNVGHNPTFGNNPLTIESHLLDYSGEKGVASVETEFLYRLRDEIRFSSSSDLKRQIGLDIRRAQRYFKLQRKFQNPGLGQAKANLS